MTKELSMTRSLYAKMSIKQLKDVEARTARILQAIHEELAKRNKPVWPRKKRSVS